jgi:hypothetical protein
MANSPLFASLKSGNKMMLYRVCSSGYTVDVTEVGGFLVVFALENVRELTQGGEASRISVDSGVSLGLLRKF